MKTLIEKTLELDENAICSNGQGVSFKPYKIVTVRNDKNTWHIWRATYLGKLIKLARTEHSITTKGDNYYGKTTYYKDVESFERAIKRIEKLIK